MNSVVDHTSLVVRQTNGDESMSVSKTTRWIAAATGCYAGTVGIPVLSLLAPGFSIFLVFGAALPKRYGRAAMGLMWFGAVVTSLWAIPFGLWILHLSFKGGTDPVAITAAAVGVSLVIACDAALIKEEAIGQRRTTDDQRRS